MLSPRWTKVLRDLWMNKARTILVVLSIAVGVFALGAISSSGVFLSRDLNAAYLAVNPASAIVSSDAFDQDIVDSIRSMRGVSDAEGRRRLTVRVKVGADQWRDFTLTAVSDYNDIRIDKIFPQTGAWPPPDRELLVERASVGLINADVGDSIVIKLPDGNERTLPIAGLAHDLNEPPAAFMGSGYGYITMDTLEWLGEPREYNELHFVVASDPMNKEHIQAVANQVQDKLESAGLSVFYVYVPDPGKYPAEDILMAITLVLQILGFMVLALSGFLVANTITALMAQQVRQIGIMKTIGARNSQIASMYVGMVLCFGLLALLISVPLGALGARAFSSYLANMINFDLSNFGTPPRVLMMEIGVGLMVPLIAAAYPILTGTRMTVREAVSDYGLGAGGTGPGTMVGLLDRVRCLPRPLLLSIRNTFRRRGRLALTLVTLTLGGAIFMAVFSVRASLFTTLDDLFKYWRYDVQVSFPRTYSIEKICYESQRVPGVTRAECWNMDTARRLRPNGTESNNLFMVGPPIPTDMILPSITRGRWLLPGDENALVVNTDVLREEPDIEVGDTITLKIMGRETSWKVVGVAGSMMSGPMVYANQTYLAKIARQTGRSAGVQVVTSQHDSESQDLVARSMEEHFRRVGMRVTSISTTGRLRSQIEFEFNILVVSFLFMAILMAVVGALGLMGTMSINVLERMREIGVMRAIGASDGAVLQVFMVEGIIIGLVSWVFSSLLAFPLSKVLCDAVGNSVLKAPLSFNFSLTGLLLWLIVVFFLSALASYLPARSASRLSVREVLAYL